MPNYVKNYYYPESIDEALTLLQQQNSKLLAGGTALTISNGSALDALIDLQKLNLSYITEKDEYFYIGAMTSAYDIFVHSDLPNSLKSTADNIGDIPLLHAVTLGGNLAVLYPWVDFPPMLWALNASIVLYDPQKKILSSDEFFTYSKEKNIGSRKALIVEIQLPKPPTNSFSEFQCLTLIKNEKSQLNLASYFSWDSNGTIIIARLVISAATKIPTRLNSVEQLILGKNITTELINECMQKSREDNDFIPNYKSSKEYRREILGVYVRRTLNNCLKKIKEGIN